MNLHTEDLSLLQIAKRWLAGKVGGAVSGSFGFSAGSSSSRYGLMDRQGNTGEMLRAFRSLVFACIHVRANAVANAGQLGKFKVKLERGVNDFIDVENDHPLAQLLRNPNPYMSRFEHWYLTQTYKDLVGNSYWWISRDALGVPRELWTLPADKVKIVAGDTSKGEKIIKGYTVNWGYGNSQEIDERDIVHLKHPNPLDPYYYGASRMMRAAREIDIEDFIAEHQREFFKNDATPASVVTFPTVLSPEARRAFEEQWGNKFKRKPGSTGFSSKAEKKILDIQKQLDADTSLLIAEKMQLERDIELFSKDHREEFDADRTKTFTFGLVKLRWLPKKVSMLSKWTVAKCLEEIKRGKKYTADFIRIKEEINKDAIQSANLPPEELAKIGIVLTQDEEFYYEAFKTDLPGSN